jgi:hypothetical protein
MSSHIPETKASYRPVKNDGALYKCTDCGEHKPYFDVWYTSTPDGTKSVCCKECIDPYWIKHFAVFDPTPI